MQKTQKRNKQVKKNIKETIMIGTGELIVILCVVLVLFGGKKLPELARSLGLGIREFKKACSGVEEDELSPPHQKKAEKEPVTILVEPEDNNSRRP
jgi:sec-independent protein translocase protein TatA